MHWSLSHQGTTNPDRVVDRSLDALRRELPKFLFNHILEQSVTVANREGRAEALVLDPLYTIGLVKGNDLRLEIVNSLLSSGFGSLSSNILLVDGEELLSDEDIGDGGVGRLGGLGGLGHDCIPFFVVCCVVVYARDYIKASCFWQLQASDFTQDKS